MSLLKVTLPSLGLLYDKNHKLYDKKEVFIKKMGGKEENILSSVDLIRSGRFMDELIKSCIVDEDFKNNIDDMFVGDKNAILFAIRVYGVSPDYDVLVRCKQCNEPQEHSFKLGDVQCVGICHNKNTNLSDIKNLFTLTLNDSKKVVSFKLLTNKENKEVENINEKLRQVTKSDIDQIVTLKLKAMIQSIDNITSKEEISNFIDNEMSRKDIFQLKKYINEITPDINLEEVFKCKKCGFTDVLGLPQIDANFFWPK